MPINKDFFHRIKSELENYNADLLAVSKTKSSEDIYELFILGQRDFGENKVQELTAKQKILPGDIRWHFIGHLQTNKVKYILPFIYMIHSVDSIKLVKEIQKKAAEQNRKIKVLFQIHIAEEESKFGIPLSKVDEFIGTFEILKPLNIEVCGLMGMATFTDDHLQISKEFQAIAKVFSTLKSNNVFGPSFNYLSIGMSDDYFIALEAGGNMVRIGSSLFGAR